MTVITEANITGYLSAMPPEFLERLRQAAVELTAEQRGHLQGPNAELVASQLIDLKMKEVILNGFDDLSESFAQGAIADGSVIDPHADVYAHLIGEVRAKHALLVAPETAKTRKPKKKLLRGK